MGFSVKNIRANYNKVRKNRGFANKIKDRLTIPKWMKKKDDEALKKIYKEYKILYDEGEVYLSYLIQANQMLFEKGYFDHPACILYSTDKYYDDNIEEIGELAKKLYSYKGKEDVSDSVKTFTDAITDELTRLMNVKLPYELTDGRDVYYTTIMVHRNHIPDGYIKYNEIPVLANPDKTDVVIILPKHYWGI